MSEREARRCIRLALAAFAYLALTDIATTQRPSFRTLNDTFEPPHFTSIEAWNKHAAYPRTSSTPRAKLSRD